MRFFWFDLETTGLSPVENQIVQLAWIQTDEKLMETSSGQVFFKHRKGPWSAEAEAVHGFSQEYLEKHGIEPHEITDYLIDVIPQGLSPIPGGHNVQFDLGFLREVIPRSYYRDLLDYHSVDSMVLATAINIATQIRTGKPMFKSVKLTEVSATLGVPLLNAHNALDDVRASLDCYRIMLDKHIVV